MASWAAETFGAEQALIGMVHLQALPGTPHGESSVEQIVETAVREAKLYEQAGFSGVMLENMHDRPYVRGAVGPEIVAAMTAAAREVAREVRLPLGLQILAGANKEAVAVAHACGAGFVRVEGYVFGHVADEGWMDSSAAELLRFRKAIGAAEVKVCADIKKKHAAHAATADVDLVTTAEAAEFFSADGVIVTGTATGKRTDPREVEAVAASVALPVFVGSGIDTDNVSSFPGAAALIVGSSVKHGGRWDAPVDFTRARALVEAFTRA